MVRVHTEDDEAKELSAELALESELRLDALLFMGVSVKIPSFGDSEALGDSTGLHEVDSECFEGGISGTVIVTLKTGSRRMRMPCGR